MVLAFGNCRLDTERRELICGTKLVELEPMAFDLLAYLVRNRDRVVSKDDLLHAIWDGRVVSDSAITTRINAARRALGDDGAAQRLIRTVTRKGFRFVGEVTEQCASSFPVCNGYHECRSAEIPSIAILPFRTSGDLARDGFADAMVEEIAIALSRIRWLRVIVRDLAFAHRDPGLNIQAAARELGVRYVLEGSVRTAGKRVRITVRLIEAATGAHLWAEPFDGSSRPAFDLQKSVVSSVAGAIEPVLQASEAALSLDSLPGDLSAYKAYLRALAMFKTSSRQIPRALAAAEEAIGRDPNCGLALTLAARCCMLLCLDGSSKHPERDQRKGLRFRPASAARGQRRCRNTSKCCNGVGVFWPGRWHSDCACRSCPLAQRQFCTRLACQRDAQKLVWSTRYRDRACRERLSAQPTRRRRSSNFHHRDFASHQTTLR